MLTYRTLTTQQYIDATRRMGRAVAKLIAIRVNDGFRLSPLPILRALIPIIFGVLLFFISPTGNAVPIQYYVQYCSKLSNHLKNIICDMENHGNGELMGLDYQVSLIYEFALFASKNPTNLKKNQRLWLKKKESCQDQACVLESNRNRIQELKAIIDGHPNKPESPENSDLKGLWFSDGGTKAQYGNILITDNTIVWGGSESFTKKYCKTTYSIEKEPFGTSFQDQIGGTYLLNEKSQFKTYKLKLKPRRCLYDMGHVNYLRFTLPFSIPNYADVMEYSRDYPYNTQNYSPASYMRFMKNNN